MAYCPECGSEVAQNDVFCPYCGISLVIAPEQPATKTALEQPPTSDLLKENSFNEFSQVNEKVPDIKQSEIAEPLVPPTEIDKTPLIETLPQVNQPSLDIVEKDNYSVSEDKDSIIETKNEAEIVEAENNQLEVHIPNKVVEHEPNLESILPVIPENSASLVNSGEDTLSEAETPVIENGPQVIEKEPVINLDNEVDSAIPEIPELEKQVVEEFQPNNVVKNVDFDLTIPDSYLPKPIENNSTKLDEQDNVNEISPSENFQDFNDEEKLKSVLDEIDLNFQNQSKSDGQKLEDNLSDTGEIIPTAATLRQDIPPNSLVQEEISKPFSVIEPNLDSLEMKTPEFEENISVNPINLETEPKPKDKEIPETPVEVIPENPIPVKQNVIEDVENKEARSFTNPNMGVGDTDNRNKTKLKPLDEGIVLNNRYEIVRKIGGGGMGAVYLATDKNLGGVLRAVKEMVQSYIEDEQQEKAVSDFKRESLLLTSLEHSSIPTIYDYFFDEKENRFYLVMKYISGGDLAARLRATPEGRIDEVSVTDWAIQITDVLDYLHNRQPPIVYRDLKPSNIMVDGNSGKLMLIDFGIARWVNNKEEKGVTAVGTMGYAPPELFSGNVEPRSDIYSLGSTMFHLLTGADPQSNPLLIFDFNKNPKPRQINPQLSDQMEQILMRAVEYNSLQRFNSSLEMREELIKHMENLKKGTVTFGVTNSTSASSINSNVPVFCGFCGQKIVASDMFCPFCGAQQPLAAQSKKLIQTPVYNPPTIFPKLVIVGTSDLSSTDYVLEKESNLLGRRDPMSNIFPEVDLSKFDPQTKISRKHARIWREGDVYMLEDLGSSNGTVLISNLNGSIRLLPRQPQVLSNGDKIKLGDTNLRFTL